MKHQVYGAQQKKARSDDFNCLDESSAFWLKYFVQKVLPVEF